MTVKKICMILIAVMALLSIVVFPAMAAYTTSEDEEYAKMVEYVNEDHNTSHTVTVSDTDNDDDEAEQNGDDTDLKITPTLKEGQDLFDKFSFADESYDLISLLNFLFYFMACGGTIWVGILALKDILKGTTDAKSIYNDIKGRRSVQGIIITVLTVRVVYVVIDFIFNYDM